MSMDSVVKVDEVSMGYCGKLKPASRNSRSRVRRMGMFTGNTTQRDCASCARVNAAEAASGCPGFATSTNCS
ncbi:hypothetical protein D3C72_2358760 [compost metagenome]